MECAKANLALAALSYSTVYIYMYAIFYANYHYPFISYSIYRHGYLGLMIAGTWLIAFSFMIPTWHGIWGKFGLDTSIGSCSILYDKYGRSPKEFLFVIAFMVPCICIVICYARIFYTVRKAAIKTREPAAKKSPPPNVNNVENVIQNNTAKAVNESEDIFQKAFKIDDDIEYIDMSDSNEYLPTNRICTANNDSSLEKVSCEITFNVFNSMITKDAARRQNIRVQICFYGPFIFYAILEFIFFF